jgi:hypothetical protein
MNLYTKNYRPDDQERWPAHPPIPDSPDPGGIDEAGNLRETRKAIVIVCTIIAYCVSLVGFAIGIATGDRLTASASVCSMALIVAGLLWHDAKTH